MSDLSERFAAIENLSLKAGKHGSLEDGACIMEAASYIAGEPWSDHPRCVCPVITKFLICWNDDLPSDAERERLLKPLIPQIINTRSSGAVEQQRAYLALDWLIRVYTPTWLALVPSLSAHAAALRALDEIMDMAGAISSGKLTAAARTAAWDAAWDAAGYAARAAAWDAARAAAGAAAWDAAWDAAGYAARAAAWDAARAAAGAAAWDAAWDAAGYAARAAAWDAARAAAGAAAGDAAWVAARDAAWVAAWDAAGYAARAAAWDAALAFIKPTTEMLQSSAIDLVARMIAVR